MSRLPEPGETWNDRYEMTAELGRGGFGRVYRAWDPLLERDVAVKLLRPSEDFTPTDHQRFRREINIAASLDHPNIVTVFDGGEHDGLLFLVMRFVNGRDLRYELERGPLAPRRAVSIIRQVGGALDYAHGRGLVHRDVKPGNMLCQAGSDEVFLADFGISRRVDQTTDHSLTKGLAPATLAYAAPEQLRTAARVDGRADVYALGCVLYECLTGRKPFDGDIPAMISAHLHEPPPRPTDARAELSRAWDRVIATALAKDVAERHQRCDELIRVAESALPASERAADAATAAWADAVADPTVAVERGPSASPGPPSGRRNAQRTARLDPGTIPTERAAGGGPRADRPTQAWRPTGAGDDRRDAPARGPRGDAPPRGPRRDAPTRRGRRIGQATLALIVIALLGWFVWPAIAPTPGDEDAGTAAGDDGGAGSLDDAQRQLLADVGMFDASDCEPSSATSLDGEQLAVACSSRDQAPTRVVFRRFETSDDRDAAFERLAGSAPDGDCRDGDRAVHDYRGAGGVGRVVCAVDSATAGLSWTVPDQPILGSARLDDPAAADELYAWWAAQVERSDS